MAGHRFGGPWTEIKLAAVKYYLECYTKALRRVPFDLWYIDAFAGSGSREVERVAGGLFDEDGPGLHVVTETLDGSARLSLKVEPPFQHFVFVEADAARAGALNAIKLEEPGRDIVVLNGDANQVLADLVSRKPWTEGDKSRSRGVVFLDPYALHVEWRTLEALASTQLVDVWYLFPLRDVCRQLAKRKSGIGPKAPMLDRILGVEWQELYELPPADAPIATDMFADAPAEPEETRGVDSQGVEAWFKRRLETRFAFVSDPLPLLTYQDRQTFSLFLAVANPAKPAVDLAEKFVRYVNRQYSPTASHRK